MQNYHLVESDGIISQSSSFYANEKIWICEFCQTRNNINIDKEEIPKKDTVNYILEIENAKEEAKLKSTDDVSLVFCIDTSGSMGTGVYHDGISVKRKPPIKISPFYYGKKSQIQEQYVPTTSSRLDYIKDAIKSNINEMDSFTCKTKVGLVTFGSKVSIIGDGTLPSDEISDLSTLYNFKTLFNEAQAVAETHLNDDIRTTHKNLISTINSLKSQGKTALGPAVLNAVILAAKGGNGSSVSICTDGLSNIGIGAIGNIHKEMPTVDVHQFYQWIANYANK